MADHYRIGHNMTQPIYVGKILVATPKLDNDPVFKNSVVYLTEQENKVVMGYILNKPSSLLISDVITSMLKTQSMFNEQCIHMGGPVGQEALNLLHSDEWYARTTRHIPSSTLALSSDMVMVEKVGTGNLPQDYKMFAGISTWEERQLAMEIHKGAWLTIDEPKPDLIFSYTGKQAWTKAIEYASQQAVDTFF